MRFRSFIIAYALVLAILLFADRRPSSVPQDRYSHVVDLTDGQRSSNPGGRTRIVAPGALIPGTWAAGQIPSERLIAPLIVMDVKAGPSGDSQISLDDIAAWETQHGMIPQGAVVAIRCSAAPAGSSQNDGWQANDARTAFPVEREAARFLMEARYAIGFAAETPLSLASDRTLARQLALHGVYVVEGAAGFHFLPATGSLIIVAPAKVASAKDKTAGEAPVRVLAMVR